MGRRSEYWRILLDDGAEFNAGIPAEAPRDEAVFIAEAWLRFNRIRSARILRCREVNADGLCAVLDNFEINIK